MISGALIGDRQLVARFKALPARVKAAVDQTTDALGLRLQASVQRDYLTGQVLRVRTNRLRGSITRGAQDSRSRFESTPVTAFAYVGTNVTYGRTWEYDGIPAHDVVPIRAKALRFEIGGQVLFRKRVHIPAQGPRPFLAPALQGMRAQIITSYEALLVRVARETLKG